MSAEVWIWSNQDKEIKMICMKHLTCLQQHAGLVHNTVYQRFIWVFTLFYFFAGDIEESGLGYLPQIQVLRGESVCFSRLASQGVSNMMKATEVTESDIIGIALLCVLLRFNWGWFRGLLSKWAEFLHWFTGAVYPFPEEIHSNPF